MTDNETTLLNIDADGIHIVGKSVAEKLGKKNISPSLVSGLQGCQAKWIAEGFVVRDLIEQEPDNPGNRGVLFHKIMEDFFAEPPEKRTHARMKEIFKHTLDSKEFASIGKLPEVIKWTRDAINGYYAMGGKPEKVTVATIEDDKGKPREGLEVFVKGKIGNASRDTLGFIDRLIEDPRVEDGVVVEDWKGLALDTPIPTPTGWTTMGKIKKGDSVLGSDGRPTLVAKVSGVHNRPCFELEISTGETVVCDNVHLWHITYRDLTTDREITETVNAEELAELYENSDFGDFRIRNPDRLEGIETRLPMPSYTLGAWLTGNYPYQVNTGGLVCQDQIPVSYFFSSFPQREALLQGLMDYSDEVKVDGNLIGFTTPHQTLAEDFQILVATFGVNSTLHGVRGKTSHQNDTVYTVKFAPVRLTPYGDVRYGLNEIVQQFVYSAEEMDTAFSRSIVSVKSVPSQPTKCIGVDAEDSLYQFGEFFTLTHNTGAKVKRWNKRSNDDSGLSEARQQMVYAKLLRDRGVNVTGARLIYPVVQEIVTIDIDDESFEKRMISDIEEADATLDHLIENNTFEYTPSFLCHYCPIVKICPAAQVRLVGKLKAAHESQPEPELFAEVIEFS